MDAQEFTKLIEDPKRVHEKDAAELKRLAHDYPYSQPVQLLYAMRLKNSGEHLFNQQLGRTSILTQDRSVLYDIFENGVYTAPEEVIIEKKIQETLIEPEAEEEVVEEAENGSDHTNEGEEVSGIVAEEKETLEEANKSPEKVEEETSEPEAKEEESKSEEVAEEEAEEDLSSLSASERIKAILARSKKRQAEFEEKKSKREPVNERVRAIKERFEKIKADNAGEPATKEVEEVPSKQEEITENVVETSSEVVESEVAEDTIEAKDEVIQEEVETVLEEASTEELVPEEKEAPVFVIEEEVEEEVNQESNYQPIADDEAHTFFDWFKRLPHNTDGDSSEGSVSNDLNLNEKIELFDSFVEKLPKLKKKKSAEAKKPNADETQNSGSGALVTETLAKVYISQGHFDKATKAYQILKLKYPEKSSFFADRIQEIKNLKNSK